MVDVFISYKREERARCLRIYEKLKALELDVWFDAHLTPGRGFRAEINQSLAAARCVLVLWSPLSVESGWVQDEAGDGQERGILAAAQLAPCKLPIGLRGTHYEQLHEEDFPDDHQGWLKILTRIGDLTEQPGLADYSRVAAQAQKLFGAWALKHPYDPLALRLDRAIAPVPGPDTLNARPIPPASDQIVPTLPQPEALTGDDHAWLRIEDSIDADDYKDFQELFVGSKHLLEARKRSRRLEAWAKVDKNDAGAVAAFLQTDSFRALAAKGQAVADQLARETAARETEARRRRLFRERRLGAAASRAIEAALAGAPVAERAFALELPDLPGWPAPEMVVLPPGGFLMGSLESEADSYADERPQHAVKISHVLAFGRHQVTFAEWDAASADLSSLPRPEDQGWGRGKRPVVNISWMDAQLYLNWLNDRLGLAGDGSAWRLPTEAEWEYACRAGTQARYAFGDELFESQATFGAEKTTPVGSYPPNAFGLHDMHGNVWEWCQDNWHDNYDGAPADGRAWEGGGASRRVLRGGSWFSSPRNCRSAYRNGVTPTDRSSDLGFRLARTLSPPSS